MADSTVTDKDVVATLRLFDRGAAGLLDALRRSGPPDVGGAAGAAGKPAEPAAAEPEAATGAPGGHRLVGRAGHLIDAATRPALTALARATLPDPATWAGKPRDERCAWWQTRIRNIAAIVPAAPRVLGFVADRVPVASVSSAAVQGLAVVAVAQEYAVTAPAERISLLSEVITDRSLSVATVSELLDQRSDPRARARELLRLDAIGAASGVRRLWLIAGGVRRLAGIVGDIDSVLDGREHGSLLARGVSQLPVVGVVGGYAAERKAIARAVKHTRKLLEPER